MQKEENTNEGDNFTKQDKNEEQMDYTWTAGKMMRQGKERRGSMEVFNYRTH